MSKKISIHIGVNKTGSTAIEQYCVDHYQKLQEKGLEFFSKPFFYDHFWALYYDQPFESKKIAYLTAFFNDVAQSAKVDHLFLIDEDLCGLNPIFDGFLMRHHSTYGSFNHQFDVVMEKLKKITTGLDTQILLYVRRQDLFLESLYNQMVKQRHFFSLSFQEFLEKYPIKNLDWFIKVQTLESIFGKDNVKLNSFQKNCLSGGDIMFDCLDQLGVNRHGLDQSKHMNSRLKQEWFERVRFFNQIDFKLHPSRYFRLAGPKLIQEKGEGSYGFLAESDRKQLLTVFESSNKKLSQQYFNCENIFESVTNPQYIIDQREPLDLEKKDVHFLKRQFGL